MSLHKGTLPGGQVIPLSRGGFVRIRSSCPWGRRDVSLPDTLRFTLRLAPTRAHPLPTQPRATTCRTASLPRSSIHRAVAWWWGGVPRDVVARGGGGGRMGPCGCQASRRTLHAGLPPNVSGTEGNLPADVYLKISIHRNPYAKSSHSHRFDSDSPALGPMLGSTTYVGVSLFFSTSLAYSCLGDSRVPIYP